MSGDESNLNSEAPSVGEATPTEATAEPNKSNTIQPTPEIPQLVDRDALLELLLPLQKAVYTISVGREFLGEEYNRLLKQIMKQITVLEALIFTFHTAQKIGDELNWLRINGVDIASLRGKLIEILNLNSQRSQAILPTKPVEPTVEGNQRLRGRSRETKRRRSKSNQ